MKSLLAVSLALVTGCVSGARLNAQVRAAAGPEHLPRVLACYEEAFESAAFSGQYEATVDFDVASDSGVIRNVRVSSGRSASGEAPQSLMPCLTRALEGSRLTPGGEVPSQELHVRGLTYAFRDASPAARAAATNSAEHVLVGPRAEHCLGLYTHHPPRDITALFEELDDAKRKANSAAKDDLDGMARALQRGYDVALELRKRLELDGWQPGLGAESRGRLAEQLLVIDRTATELGGKIGCTPSAE